MERQPKDFPKWNQWLILDIDFHSYFHLNVSSKWLEFWLNRNHCHYGKRMERRQGRRGRENNVWDTKKYLHPLPSQLPPDYPTKWRRVLRRCVLNFSCHSWVPELHRSIVGQKASIASAVVTIQNFGVDRPMRKTEGPIWAPTQSQAPTTSHISEAILDLVPS